MSCHEVEVRSGLNEKNVQFQQLKLNLINSSTFVLLSLLISFPSNPENKNDTEIRTAA